MYALKNTFLMWAELSWNTFVLQQNLVTFESQSDPELLSCLPSYIASPLSVKFGYTTPIFSQYSDFKIMHRMFNLALKKTLKLKKNTNICFGKMCITCEKLLLKLKIGVFLSSFLVDPSTSTVTAWIDAHQNPSGWLDQSSDMSVQLWCSHRA